MILTWILPYWNYLPSVPILVLFNSCVLLANADNVNQAYSALINVTIVNPERSTPILLRLDRGRYGSHSPKIAVKGLLLAPLPINGGKTFLQLFFFLNILAVFWDCKLDLNCMFGCSRNDHLFSPPNPPNSKVQDRLQCFLTIFSNLC